MEAHLARERTQHHIADNYFTGENNVNLEIINKMLLPEEQLKNRKKIGVQ